MMKYYRADGAVYAFNADGSQDDYIPDGAVLMTPAEVAAHLSPTQSAEQQQERLTTAVQSHLDSTARARGYDSALSCVSYLDSTVPSYRAEATAMKLWRDAVWVRCLTLLGEVKAGQRPIPTESQLIALLPAITW